MAAKWLDPHHHHEVQTVVTKGPSSSGDALTQNLTSGDAVGLLQRANGMFFTPTSVAQSLLENFFRGRRYEIRRVLDLAAGAGSLLLAAARTFGGPLTLVGVEIDAAVAARCASELARQISPMHRVEIVCANGLDPQVNSRLMAEFNGFDLVFGNPPFLSPRLRSQRYLPVNGVDWGELRRLYPDIAGPTTDLSAYFVARAFAQLRVGGICAMIVPISFLSSEGAAKVRAVIEDQGEVLQVDRLPADSFVASVNTVCVWMQKRRDTSSTAELGWTSWGSWIAESPSLELVVRHRLVEVARVTAGFRDEFYQVARAVSEEPRVGEVAQLGDDDRCRVTRWHRVLTVGHLGWGEPRWGARAVKIGGQKFLRPVIARATLETMSPSIRGLLRPKLVVAPQKKIVAPWVDAGGTTIPLTPVVSVLPHQSASSDLSRLAAAIGSPVAAAFLEQRCAGTALSASALKFSARDLGQLPLPSDQAAWSRAGRVWPPTDDASLSLYLGAMRGAYGIEGQSWSDLVRWWLARAGLNRRLRDGG